VQHRHDAAFRSPHRAAPEACRDLSDELLALQIPVLAAFMRRRMSPPGCKMLYLFVLAAFMRRQMFPSGCKML
jgi:hypothetical protein